MPAPSFRFQVHDERLAIARLASDAPLPAWVRGGFVTVTRTRGELSIVCAQSNLPAGILAERDKIALGIEGTVSMSAVGIMAALCTTLAQAKVSVFVIATYDTDWILVSAAHFAAARAALLGAGHAVLGLAPEH